MKIGIGYDIHILKKGRKLILGGVHIPSDKGLVGHSDGDALVHAVVDALLGAMGEGDIGEHFSDQNPKLRGADSFLFIQKTKELLKQKKLKIGNIDSVIIAQTPKLSPFKKAMKQKIAQAFGIAEEKVNIKAKTNEKLGDIGKGKAIASYAVVSLK